MRASCDTQGDETDVGPGSGSRRAYDADTHAARAGAGYHRVAHDAARDPLGDSIGVVPGDQLEEQHEVG